MIKSHSIVISGYVNNNLLVFLMLALDLGIFHRKAHVIKIKESGAKIFAKDNSCYGKL